MLPRIIAQNVEDALRREAVVVLTLAERQLWKIDYRRPWPPDFLHDIVDCLVAHTAICAFLNRCF